jgi:hypothetical protein
MQRGVGIGRQFRFQNARILLFLVSFDHGLIIVRDTNARYQAAPFCPRRATH